MLSTKMKEFGFNESETNIYISLLENGSMTGYEVSKKSGVPRSKVYNWLESLVKKGVVLVNNSEPKVYSAISSEEFIDLIKRQTLTNINEIDQYLEQITEKKEASLLWQLENNQAIMSKIQSMIKHAKHNLYIQIWDEDLTHDIIEELTLAEQRLDKFVCILFSRDKHYSLPFSRFYPHGFEDDKLQDMGGKWINLVCDDSVLYGTINNYSDVIWTKHHSMRMLAAEYIKHDAYTLKIIKEHGDALRDDYQQSFEKIRDIY